MSAKTSAYPHEKRVQKFAYYALAALVAVSIGLTLRGESRIMALEIPLAASLAGVVVAAIVAGFAIQRRSDVLSAVGAGLFALFVLPASFARPDVLGYALGLLFGAALLLLIELVHMTERYERAHRAVESENVPEEHINRVTDEALRTLMGRASVASLFVAIAIGLAYALAAIGPRQWRAAVETTAPVGVAIVALALAGAVSLSILARGTTFRLRREKTQQEMLPDVAE